MSMQPPTVEPVATSVLTPRTARNWWVQAWNVHHGVPDRRAGVENESVEVLKLFSVRAPAVCRFPVSFAEDGNIADFALSKLFSHFDRYDVATAGGNHERR